MAELLNYSTEARRQPAALNALYAPGWSPWRGRAQHTGGAKFGSRLGALVKPSSADVERLFSQLELILEQIGVSGLGESYETRLMVRANRF